MVYNDFIDMIDLVAKISLTLDVQRSYGKQSNRYEMLTNA